MKLSYQIATRFLKSALTQTLIIILGIGIGVSVQIFIGSLIQGLQKSLVNTTIGNAAHVSVTDDDDGFIEDYDTVIRSAEAADDRIIAASPVLNASVLIEKDGESQSLLIRGFDLQKAENIYEFSEYLVEGAMPDADGEVLLGVIAQNNFELSVGEKISLITPDKRTVECTISGFFDYKVAAPNESWCITTLSTVQTIFELQDVASAIEFQVEQDLVFEADAVAKNVAAAITSDSDTLKVGEWKEANGQLLSGLQGQSISSIMIQVFVMISVVLGIASVLAISVMQKSRQIGILKAMGIQNRSSSLIFLFQGLILGIFGAIVGVLLGLGLSFAFTTFAVKPDGSPVVPLFIDPAFIALSAAIAVVACIVASLIPARKSSVLNPIDIIRNQ